MENKEAIKLLERYKDGSMTHEERGMLESWYNYEVENNTTHQGMQENLAKLDARFSAMLYKPEAKSRLLWPRIAAVAAVALVAFGVYLFNQNAVTDKDLHAEFVSGSKDIAPGKNAATLTLPNGKTIALSDAKNGVVIDATRIAYSDGTSLSSSSSLVGSSSSLVGSSSSLRGGTPKQSTPGDQPASSTPVILTTPRGGQYQVILPDGTHVWLNAASTLKFPAVFAKNERRVELIGEGFFEVQHNEKKPFRVISNGQMVEDLGTEFNINAYSDEANIKTTLVSGAAKVNGLILKPNEQTVLTDKSIKIVDADVEKDLAWKNGDFIFRDDDFSTVMRKVARWYDVEVVYDEDAPTDLKLAGWIPRSKNISSILNTMQSTGKVHFKVNGRRIIVEK